MHYLSTTLNKNGRDPSKMNLTISDFIHEFLQKNEASDPRPLPNALPKALPLTRMAETLKNEPKHFRFHTRIITEK